MKFTYSGFMVTASQIGTEARVKVFCLYTVLSAFLLAAVLSINVEESDVLFLIAFIVVSLAIGLAVSGWSTNQECIFLLLLTVLILRAIIPLAKPGMILDNEPDSFSERLNLLFLLNNHVTEGPPPATVMLTDSTGTAAYYANFPGVSLLLASLQMVSGIDPNVLLKYMPIFIVLPVFGAVPFIVRALGIHSERAALIATAIVVFNSQIIMGTIWSVPGCYGTILFMLGLAFFLDSISARRSASVICFVAAACALVIYHLTSSIFLIGVVSLLSLLLAIPQLRRRSQVHLGSTAILLFMIIGAVWWSVYVANMMPDLTSFAVQIFSHAPRVSVRSGVLLPQTGAGKPFWMLLIEYLTFGSLGVVVLASLFTKAEDVFLAKLLTLVGAFLALTFGSIWLLGVQLAADMFYRSFFLFTVGSAPLVGAQFRKTVNGLSNMFPHHISKCQMRNLVAGGLITLLVLNAVFFSFPLYTYDYSAPLQYDDSRYNLGKWEALGVFYTSHVDRNQFTYGPRLGQGIVGTYADANYISFGFYGAPIRVNASSFPYLPTLLRGHYVVISWDMLTAPAAPGYYPDIMTPSRISTRVYDNGQIVVLIAFAPDALIPTNSSSP